MLGLAARLLPYALAFTSSLCIMILELVSSRLVAPHVGQSLTVWTSVIGIILAGICLGNVLGGRLADRVEPRRAVGPLFALGSLLTLSSLWVNAKLDLVIPTPEHMNWELRTVLVVVLDFLVPATILGMVGPVVAKIAVEQARKAGSAIGDVYFWGAMGSIAGTFLCGFVLMYLVPTSTIVILVAAALALLSASLIKETRVRAAGIVAALLLGLGSIHPLVSLLKLGALDLGSYQLNYLVLAGNAAVIVLGITGMIELARARRANDVLFAGDTKSIGVAPPAEAPRPGLGDLAVLAFVASLVFMSLEMVAGRLVQKHLGSSIYGWTSVIGVLLAGLSFGNFLGGKIADFIKSEKQASWLFLAASILVLSVLVLETQPKWLAEKFLGGETKSLLSQAINLSSLPPGDGGIPLAWPFRILLVVALVFFLPALSLGTVSPVVAKLAVDRLKAYKRTGTAIGQVYAWGMVGSIVGTFLTGFLLIDVFGTKGVILLLGTTMAFGATVMGSVWHAIWAGIPLGLCFLAFTPPALVNRIGKAIPSFKGDSFREIGERWGIREQLGGSDLAQNDFAWIDESNYYYIKVENELEEGGETQKRTLVLDNLIHGYFILGHPERLDYDYEHIYALVAYRTAKASGNVKFKDNFPPNPIAPSQPVAVDTSEPPPDSSIPAVEKSTMKTLFLGGGAYCFQRHMQYVYPGTAVDVAEIDPHVTEANFRATGLSRNTPIKTYWGDARQFVELNQNDKQYDLIFGDAFNDFSVPWHLTTREFNEKIKKMLTPNGVYMINIIDVYETDQHAEEAAQKKIDDKGITDPIQQAKVRARSLSKARNYGGFLGAWAETARRTFPKVYIFGTDSKPGLGLRETFVVVASMRPLDLNELGSRIDDPQFFAKGRRTEPKPYGPEDEKVVAARSRNVILSDDYAPVENLLAPVAETRADDD